MLQGSALLNGGCGLASCRRLEAGRRSLQLWGRELSGRAAGSAKTEAEAVKVPLQQPVGHRFEPCRRRHTVAIPQ